MAMGQEEGSQVTLRVTDQSAQAPHKPGLTGAKSQLLAGVGGMWEAGDVPGYQGEVKPWTLVKRGGSWAHWNRFPRPLIRLGVTGKPGLCPSDTDGRLRLQIHLGVTLGKAPLSIGDTGKQLLYEER